MCPILACPADSSVRCGIALRSRDIQPIELRLGLGIVNFPLVWPVYSLEILPLLPLPTSKSVLISSRIYRSVLTCTEYRSPESKAAGAVIDGMRWATWERDESEQRPCVLLPIRILLVHLVVEAHLSIRRRRRLDLVIDICVTPHLQNRPATISPRHGGRAATAHREL